MLNKAWMLSVLFLMVPSSNTRYLDAHVVLCTTSPRPAAVLFHTKKRRKTRSGEAPISVSFLVICCSLSHSVLVGINAAAESIQFEILCEVATSFMAMFVDTSVLAIIRYSKYNGFLNFNSPFYSFLLTCTHFDFATSHQYYHVTCDSGIKVMHACI